MDTYFEAAIRQTRERARVLKAKIPRPVRHPDLVALQRMCEERLDQIISRLDYLLEDENVCDKKNLRERIRLWRRCSVDVANVEVSGIVALSRIHDDDVFLNRLVFKIHHEINYPLPPPTACCLSREYFSINTSLHLLEIPPAESDFLLHLPDLYHELGHPLLASMNDPHVEPYQNQLGLFLHMVAAQLEKERSYNLRATGPTEYNNQILDLLERAWLPWSNELFCDMFAINTLGPAYAWAHFHLTAIYGTDPFGVNLIRFLSHPPDQARMETMLIGLNLIGYQKEAEEIKKKWEILLNTLGYSIPPTYRKICPRNFLESIAAFALDGSKKIGCRIANPDEKGEIYCLLNTAWKQLWSSPLEYHEWERKKIFDIKSSFI